MGEPNVEPSSQTKGSVARRTESVKARYGRTRDRVDASAAGHFQRRIAELELMNQALLLSALALMLFIPAIITLAAFLPVGKDTGLSADLIRRVGLSPQAAHDFRQLFASRQTIRGATTGVSALVTILFAYGWPATLMHAYEVVWGLRGRGPRDLWRPLVWLFAFFGVIVAVAASGAIAHGWPGTVISGLIGLPLVLLWAWWTQHLLLGGRVSWRDLFPGAVALAVALFGMRLFMHAYLNVTITSNYHKYGSIGTVFVLLTWFIAFSVVMLGGAVVGHIFVLRRRERAGTEQPVPDQRDESPATEAPQPKQSSVEP